MAQEQVKIVEPTAVLPGQEEAAPQGEEGSARASLANGFVAAARFLLESTTGTVGFCLVAFWVLVALFAPIISPYSPYELIGEPRMPPSAEFPLGTDHVGRDLLSRLIFGSQVILTLAPASVLTATVIGMTLGISAGYFGGLLDEIIMRLLDAKMAFPSLLLYLIIIAAIGPSALNVVLAITLGSTPGIARIVRSLVLDVKTREYVAAARIRGESSLYITLVEILPNAMGPIVVDAAIRVGFAAFAIGGLGFLGLGPPPPLPDWGGMVAEGRSWILIAPWIVLFPSIAITTLVIGLNLFADGMREVSLKA
ncbi:MAG: ABC transporter permease [Chloroflexi bacterium]|nr:ABC transporter permease [Chloroflexota bacterium]